MTQTKDGIVVLDSPAQHSDHDEGKTIDLHAAKAERKYLWKLDLIVLPTLAMIYFTHSLDRANLGNAKTSTFEQNIHITGNQYDLILVLFYIPYGTLNIPLTLLSRRFNPANIIPLLMLSWGTISAASSAVSNFGGILAARICLGVVEAGFFGSAIFYLSLFYSRGEIAKRISLFYMMGFVANAFSGLIAWRVFQWHKVLHGWQYLFIIEGSLTAFLAVVAFIILPRSVESSRYFSDSDKNVARARAQREAQLSDNTPITFRSALQPLLRPSTWFFGLLALAYGIPCASVSNFLPTMIKRLTHNTVKANLYTIAPNISGAIFIIIVSFLSDYFLLRSPFIILASMTSMLGFILLGALHSNAVGYFCTFLITFGTFTNAVLVPAWVSANVKDKTARATTLGLVTGMQNLGGIVSSESFRQEDAPVYRPALIVSGVSLGVVVVLAGSAWMLFGRRNRSLVEGQSRYVV